MINISICCNDFEGINLEILVKISQAMMELVSTMVMRLLCVTQDGNVKVSLLSVYQYSCQYQAVCLGNSVKTNWVSVTLSVF